MQLNSMFPMPSVPASGASSAVIAYVQEQLVQDMFAALGAASVERVHMTGSFNLRVADFGDAAPTARSMFNASARVGADVIVMKGADGIATSDVAAGVSFLSPLVGHGVRSVAAHEGVIEVVADSEFVASTLRPLFGQTADGIAISIRSH